MTLDTQQQTTPAPEQAEPAADALAIESEAPLLDDADDGGGEQQAEAAPDPVASVRADLDRERERAATLERSLADTRQEMETRLKRVSAATQAAIRNQAMQLHDQYNAAKREAVQNGDVQRYDELNRQHAAAIREFDASVAAEPEAPAEQPKAQQPAKMPPEVQKAVAGFTQRHASWWDTDKKLTEAAISLHGALLQTRPDLTIDQNLAIVEQQLAIAHPDKFKRPAPATQLQGGSRMAGSSQPRGRGWADIPANDRKLGESQVHLFLPPGVKRGTATERDIAAARAEYAKEYWSADQ